MIPGLLVAFIAGLLLATANYLALWLTVKMLVAARNPTIPALSSFLGRTAIVVLGFYMVTKGDPIELAVCVLGFLLVRTIALRRMAPEGAAKEGAG